MIPGGIYYVPTSGSRSLPIYFQDFAAPAPAPVGHIDTVSLQGISASRDNRALVFSRRESNDRDLMLMEFAR